MRHAFSIISGWSFDSFFLRFSAITLSSESMKTCPSMALLHFILYLAKVSNAVSPKEKKNSLFDIFKNGLFLFEYDDGYSS